MQIDGHHAATYVAARIAGLSFEDASKVAYAAQYVDDATNSGVIVFDGHEYMYSRIASAHKMVDYSNLVDVENHLAWIPFHFLPGNAGLPAGTEPCGESFVKLICRPDSHVARDMLRCAFMDKGKARALHRLGIAMHVYADTFAHQGFLGALHPANQARELTSGDELLDAQIKRETKRELFQAVQQNAKAVGQFIWKVMAIAFREHRFPVDLVEDFMHKSPVGHAAVDVYPDQPYLIWSYLDYENKRVERNNPQVFLQAIDSMVKVLRAWIQGDQSLELERYQGLSPDELSLIGDLFSNNRHISGELREQVWMQKIAAGAFGFGKEVPVYVGKGEGSWKSKALGNEKYVDTGYEAYSFNQEFMSSDWKLFHDALQCHRNDVIREVLPNYGICAA